MYSINRYSIYCTCPGQSYKHLLSANTPTHAAPCHCSDKRQNISSALPCSLYPLALDFTSLSALPRTQTTHNLKRVCTAQTTISSTIYLSHRRIWRFSPLSSPPGRCSGPCGGAEPWGCAAWTSHRPFSLPAPSSGPPAATASPSHPGNAARRVR